MDLRFDNKVALVTGGGKGIGRGIAIKLADLGAKVHVISRTQTDLDSLKQEIPSIEVYNVDLADWYKTRSAVESIVPIDYLVNNAAVGSWTPFLDVQKEEFDNLFDINFRAVFNVSQVVAKAMIQRGNGGSIVNISSISALRASINHTIYCPSKAAVDMLTKAIAKELGPYKIRVNSINPGLVLTPMVLKEAYSTQESQERIKNRTPLRQIAEVDDIVNACVFLLSDRAAMIQGISMTVDGGFVL